MNSFQNTKSIMINQAKWNEIIAEFLYLESVLKETNQDSVCKKLRSKLQQVEGGKV
jgi:hypothetical protein